MTTADSISKNLEESRAARRERARAAAAPQVAEIQAEQARRDSLSESARRREDVERALRGVRFSRVRDYIISTPTQTDTGRWTYPVEFTLDGIDWYVGDVRFFTGPRGGQTIRLHGASDPNAPWLPLLSDEDGGPR